MRATVFIHELCIINKGARLLRASLMIRNEWIKTVQSTFHGVFCLLYTYWDIYHSGSQQWKIVIRSLLLNKRFFPRVKSVVRGLSLARTPLRTKFYDMGFSRVCNKVNSLSQSGHHRHLHAAHGNIDPDRIFLDLFFCYPTPWSGHADNPESTLGSSRAINLVPRCVNDAFSPVYPRFTFSIPSCCLENWSLLSPWLELL